MAESEVEEEALGADGSSPFARMSIPEYLSCLTAIVFVLTVVYLKGLSWPLGVDLLPLLSIPDYLQFSIRWIAPLSLTLWAGACWAVVDEAHRVFGCLFLLAAATFAVFILYTWPGGDSDNNTLSSFIHWAGVLLMVASAMTCIYMWGDEAARPRPRRYLAVAFFFVGGVYLLGLSRGHRHAAPPFNPNYTVHVGSQEKMQGELVLHLNDVVVLRTDTSLVRVVPRARISSMTAFSKDGFPRIGD